MFCNYTTAISYIGKATQPGACVQYTQLLVGSFLALVSQLVEQKQALVIHLSPHLLSLAKHLC